jgi:hypothetical protein
MGRFCILCGCVRPNEAFGGKGERARICRKCRRLPRTRRDALKCEQEILGFLEQSHVSDKNLARLRALKSSPDIRIANLAAVVLDVSVATPYRRRRFRILARQHRDLLKRMRRLRGRSGSSIRRDWSGNDPSGNHRIQVLIYVYLTRFAKRASV